MRKSDQNKNGEDTKVVSKTAEITSSMVVQMTEDDECNLSVHIAPKMAIQCGLKSAPKKSQVLRFLLAKYANQDIDFTDEDKEIIKGIIAADKERRSKKAKA